MADDTPIPSPNVKFERFKYVVELLKWAVVSVGLVIMTTIIDSGFKDRAAGIQEIHEYDKYVTDQIVLNNKDVKPRLRLAQYFANVTASEKLKKGWFDYYNELRKELSITVDSIEVVNRELSDLRLKKDLTQQEKERKKQLELLYKYYDSQLKDTLILPTQRLNVEINPAQLKNFEQKLKEKLK